MAVIHHRARRAIQVQAAAQAATLVSGGGSGGVEGGVEGGGSGGGDGDSNSGDNSGSPIKPGVFNFTSMIPQQQREKLKN